MNVNNAIQIVPLSIYHVLTCPEIVPTGYHISDYANVMAKNPYSYTALLDGVPVLMAGVLPLWKGVGEAWTFIKDEAKSRPSWLTRTVKRTLEQIARDHGFHRLQANCDPTDRMACRWLQTLEFKKEGLMHLYSPDKRDRVMYARTFK